MVLKDEDIIGKEFLQNCGDTLKVLERTDKYNKQRNVLFRYQFQKYFYEDFATKQRILDKSVVNPQIEKVEFVDKLWPQKCGDTIKIICKSNIKTGTAYLFECEFQKYFFKTLATKQNILKGSVQNPQIEKVEFMDRIWPQHCGDSLKILEKTDKKLKGNNYLYKVSFIKIPYVKFVSKIEILRGSVDNPYYIDIEHYPFLQKENLKQYIQENFKERKPTLKELADAFNISDSYIGKYINKFDLRDLIFYFPVSQQEQKIREFCKKLDSSTSETGVWSILSNKEIDIYIPNFNLGIEFNGNLWHSTDIKFGKIDICCHQKKSLEALDKNIQILHIFEYEYETKKEIIYSLIKHKLGFWKRKLYARQCQVRFLSNQIYQDFCNKNHLQGECGAKIKLGLFYKDELVQIMSFGVPRFTNKYEWEILRECSKLNYLIVGGKEKLWSYFLKNYLPKNCISYCDFSKFTGESYLKLGFKKERLNKPGFVWYNKCKNQVYWRDPFHNKEMQKAGYSKIYDAGQLVFIWNKKNSL